MALRFVEIFIPVDKQVSLFDLLEEFESVNIIQKEVFDKLMHVKLLMRAERIEELLDRLEARFSNVENFRIVIVAVEATIPRIENNSTEDSKSTVKPIKFARVSREELYHDVQEASELSYLFMTMLALSSVVAAIGLMRNNTAVVIGAICNWPKSPSELTSSVLSPRFCLQLRWALFLKNTMSTARKFCPAPK